MPHGNTVIECTRDPFRLEHLRQHPGPPIAGEEVVDAAAVGADVDTTDGQFGRCQLIRCGRYGGIGYPPRCNGAVTPPVLSVGCIRPPWVVLLVDNYHQLRGVVGSRRETAHQ